MYVLLSFPLDYIKPLGVYTWISYLSLLQRHLEGVML